MQRYFVNIENKKVILNDDDIHHLIKVMRMHEGDQIEVVDKQTKKVFLSVIDSVSPLQISIIHEILNYTELDNKITLFICPPKGDKLDLILQKAVELGVFDIFIVMSSRTIVRINKNEQEKKISRYQAILKDAARQSKRNIVPVLRGIIDIKEIDKHLHYKNMFICDESYKGSLLELEQALLALKKDENIALLIGPEGGFSNNEFAFLHKCGLKSITLGKRTLRSETAVIYILSIIAFFLEKNETL